MSKKEVAFALFAEGKVPLSPEVKALGLKGSTRYNYYYEWEKKEGNPPPSSLPQSEGKLKGSKVINELEMVVPPEEVNEESEEAEDEVKESEEEVDEEGKPEPEKPKPEGKVKPTDGKRPPPMMVAGQGLTFAITISTKTLMLYQYAASRVDEELTLGDFIDTCVEDTYRGRGLDLGLVSIGGKSD